MKTVLVTGSSGLIGSEAVLHFDRGGYRVVGVDNNMRADFFGPKGDTTWNLERLKSATKHFEPRALDIRNRDAMLDLVRAERPVLIVHCAAQPSHDLAATRPFDDFDVNAVGTLNLLEAVRQHARESPFVLLSTNKVYGDGPNRIALREDATRWTQDDPAYVNGIPEDFPIDHCLHSVFGASKVAADVMTQEYGRYFGLATVCFRGGCLTGPSHSGVELHGFLSYLVHAVVHGIEYTVHGYKGKQVRDQIHSADVLGAIEAFRASPKSGAVYNVGGGTENNCSVLEAFSMVEAISGRKARWTYSDQARRGDHIWYVSDLSRLRGDYPAWRLQHSLSAIVEEMVRAELARVRD